MKNVLQLLLTAFLLTICACSSERKELPMTNFYDIKVKTIDGKEITMSKYKGKVLLIVNTASKCGFTGQFEGLQKLYEKYSAEGFEVLGFPSNDFLYQEPKSNPEIREFCKLEYGVTFPMFEKIHVRGSEQCQLYNFLTSGQSNTETKGRITWNFNKFLISKDGVVVAKFGSMTSPENKKITDAIENELAKLN